MTPARPTPDIEAIRNRLASAVKYQTICKEGECHSLIACYCKMDALLALVDELRGQNERLAECVADYRSSPSEIDDKRISYRVVQVSHSTDEEADEVLAFRRPAQNQEAKRD